MKTVVFRIPAPEGTAFGLDAFDSHIGAPVGHREFSGTLCSAVVEDGGAAVTVAVEMSSILAGVVSGPSGAEVFGDWFLVGLGILQAPRPAHAAGAPVMSEPIAFRLTAPDGEVFVPDAPLPANDWRTLLADAERALTASFKSALTVKTSLTTPYPDSPQQTPWSQFAERPARNAHNTAMRIRKFLRDNPEVR
jgi:hypothetical protein